MNSISKILKDVYPIKWSGLNILECGANRFGEETNSFENDNLLHLNNYVTEENLFPTEEISPELFVKPFAIIELQLNKVKTDQYYINFQEKSSYWRYLLVSDHFKTLTNPAVLNPLINFYHGNFLIFKYIQTSFVFCLTCCFVFFLY